MNNKTPKNNMEEKLLELSFEKEAWELRKSKIKFYANLATLFILIIDLSYVLVAESNNKFMIVGVVAILASALRSSLSAILKSTEVKEERESIKSLIRLYFEEKITRRLFPGLKEKLPLGSNKAQREHSPY